MRAWQRVIHRHPALRTAFHWESRDEPFQVVYRRVTFPCTQLDWRDISTVDRTQQLEALLTADRKQGFQLSKAPLMRFYLIRMAQEEYQCIWSHHHLLFDGWSLAILLREASQCYTAFRDGQEPPLRNCRPYSDYITWLLQQDLGTAEAFWRQTLKSYTAPHLLPLRAEDNAPVGDASHEEQHRRLSAASTAALRILAQQQQLSLNTLVQGAWALLLSRYSGQEDVVFGATVSGRPAELTGVEAMVGLFINTLPVRARVAPDDMLLPWLQALQAHQVEARQYEYSPLVHVQRWSEVQPGQSLFESILVFENYPVRASPQEWGGGLESRHAHLLARTNYPLTVVAVPGSELALRINYQCHDFDTTTIVRMLGHMQTLLEGMATNPARRLVDLPMLTQVERHQLLMEWNDTATAYPQDTCIHQLFEAQVSCTPDAVATVFENQALTYRELNSRANQLAHHLRSLGVGPEVLVGLCVERSFDMVVGLLGILKAGGAYIPLDPDYPSERLTFMASDAQIPVLVTQQKFVTKFPKHGGHLLCMDTDWERVVQQSTSHPVSNVTPEHLAYVIYTSGSTGPPKGVMIPHRALRNHMAWMQATFPLSGTDRVVQKTSSSFDASVWEFFAPLSTGGQLLLARAGGHRDSAYLVALLVTHQVTVLKLVPSLLQMLLEDENLATCQSLRHVFCGAEVLPPTLQERFFARLGANLHNLYGPTETTIDVTGWRCQRGKHRLVVPIGHPIANTQVYLMDTHLRPVPLGVAGEISIGGASLARGYLNRPMLTAQAFIPNPYSDTAGSRLYRSGDRARYFPNGNLAFLGRLDQQVKIHGYRIEPGEIEAALAHHPSIRQAVVLAREDTSGDKRLVAYIVPQHEPAPSSTALWSFLRAKLPDYMVPAIFMTLAALPLTPSGKIDRQALPIPGRERPVPVLEEAFSAPHTPIEELLAGIWESVLGLEAIGIHDNFFALGGHSLLAMRVIARLRHVLQVEVPLRALFDTPTVAELARYIETSQQSMPAPPIQAVSRQETVPLTMTQEHLWGLDQLLPGAPFSNMPYAVRLTGVLNVAALEQSFNEMIKRHEVLRTTFTTIEEQPIQVIAPALHLPLTVEDCRGLPPAEREAEVQQLLRKIALYPFDLMQGPLLYTRLLHIDDHEYILLVVMHHIISDGWSMGLLNHELAVLYEAFSHGKPSPLPALSLQYADFAHWQRQWLHSDRGQVQRAYWRQQLSAPLPALELPVDRPRTGELSLRTARQAFQLSQALSMALKHLSQQEGTTVFMTLMAAFNVLLYGYTGQEELRVGTLAANRQQQETEDLIGLFANLVVLRLHLGANPTLREVLRRTRATTLGAYMHQEVPFEHVVRTLEHEQTLSRQSLFQAMFVMQNAKQRPLQLPMLTLEVLETYPVQVTPCDIVVSVRESPQGLAGSCIYKTALFDETTITRMLADFERVLTCLSDSLEQPLSSFRSLWARQS